MSMTDGSAYLRAICQSLLNQGFRRQVLLTAHGPAFMTVLPMLTQFLDETKVPLFYGDFSTLLQEAGIESRGNPGLLDEMIYGAYLRMNRLEDVPIGMNMPEIVVGPESDTSNYVPKSIFELWPKNGSYTTAWKCGNVLEHGGNCVPVMSKEELQAKAESGLAKLKDFADKLNFRKKLDALRDLDVFHQEVIMPLYGEHLVRNKYSTRYKFADEDIRQALTTGNMDASLIERIQRMSMHEDFITRYPETYRQGLRPSSTLYLCRSIRVNGIRVATMVIGKDNTQFLYSAIQLVSAIQEPLSQVFARIIQEKDQRTMLHNLLFFGAVIRGWQQSFAAPPTHPANAMASDE